MKCSKRLRERRRSMSDGHEPDDFFTSSKKRTSERKTQQLCAEVERTLVLLLGSETIDACLQGLWVDSVEPAPNASRLLVKLRPWGPTASHDLGAVLEGLAAIKGYLRTQVAASIHRKRAPDLVFQVLPEGET